MMMMMMIFLPLGVSDQMFPCFDQSVKKQKFRFSVIMNELLTTTVVPYQVALMGVINVLVLGQEDLRKRGFLRREFLGTV